MDSRSNFAYSQSAQGDPAKLALATVDSSIGQLPGSERAALTESLEGRRHSALVQPDYPHGAAGDPGSRQRYPLARLSRLTVVEPFPARGEHATDVHEAARLALRKRMATNDQTTGFAHSVGGWSAFRK